MLEGKLGHISILAFVNFQLTSITITGSYSDAIEDTKLILSISVFFPFFSFSLLPFVKTD